MTTLGNPKGKKSLPNLLPFTTALAIMSAENPTIIHTNGSAPAPSNGISHAEKTPISRCVTGSYKAESSNLGTFGVKSGLAQMLKGGVIMVRSTKSMFRL